MAGSSALSSYKITFSRLEAKLSDPTENFNPGLFNHELSNPRHFNPRLFNHELFNPGLSNPKSGVENSGDGKFMVEKSGVERSGIEVWG